MIEREIIARFKRYKSGSVFHHIGNILFGQKRIDGIRRHWKGGRKAYISWWWGAYIKKWLKAPLRCKLGRHRIGPKSDTGMGCGQTPGTMDVWCLDCDSLLEVPIDDVLGTADRAEMILDLSKKMGLGKKINIEVDEKED